MKNIRETLSRISAAVEARRVLLDERHEAALRLFNGFYEGCPDLVVDVFARNLVLYDHSDPPGQIQDLLVAAIHLLVEQLPWINSVVVKTRNAPAIQERRGVLWSGEAPADRILEHGVWYALDLTMNQDASLYIDTRNLRSWLKSNLAGRTLLNTFAYTGSLGAAALAGGARRVVQTDLSRKFLNLARRTYQLNGFPARDEDFRLGDFYRQMSMFKQSGQLFDCVILDPPFFSVTEAGRVDLASESQRLINKVRPLVAHQGWLVAVNNALFVSGQDFIQLLEGMCREGFMKLETLIPVPLDVTGYPETRLSPYPADPAPFNHPTKIAILRLTRKDGRQAS